MSELSDQQLAELAGGGLCGLHYHDTKIIHENIDQFQQNTGVKIMTANYTVTYRDDIIVADTTGGNITITIPLARAGKEFTIVKGAAANILTIQLSGTDKVWGNSSTTITSLGVSTRLKSIVGGFITL